MVKDPALSVVVASVNGRPYIDACLSALHSQTGCIATEIVVADCVGEVVTRFIRSRYPCVHLIEFYERRTVAELRAAGLLAASGEIVAITEDHCIPAQDWCKSLIKCHRDQNAGAIGGAVENGASDRLIDWSVYICEYSRFTSPVTHGVVHELPAPNVSYKQSILTDLRDLVANGYRERELHEQIEKNGETLWSDPSLLVWHKKHFTLRSYIQERFHYGRWFAGTRFGSNSGLRRFLYVACSPLLPPLILFRIARNVLRQGRNYGWFLASLPLLGLYSLIWALGECVGYALGPSDSERYLS